MDAFQQNELVSLSDISMSIAMALVLLAIIFFILKKFKPDIVNQLNRIKKTKNIQLVDKSYIPKLGHVYIISIKSEEFIVVQSKNSISICPLQKNRHKTESTDITSQEC